MALLGTFIDITRNISQTGAGAIQTVGHSLGTQPDVVLVQVRSQASGSVALVLAQGANASLASVGIAPLSNTTTLYDVICINFWVPMR